MDEQLIEHLLSVYRFALRLTCGDLDMAEDLTQETMLRAIGKLHTLKQPDQLRSWLRSITANLWRDRLRKRLHGPLLEPHKRLDEIPANSACRVERRLELDETVRACLSLLDRLPERQRTVLYLTACEQCSIGEIAEVLQITPQAVKASLCVARSRMRGWLATDETDT